VPLSAPSFFSGSDALGSAGQAADPLAHYLPISRRLALRDPAQNPSTEQRGAGPARAGAVSRGSPRFETWSGTLARVAGWQTLAAANNAKWCDLVCGSHGAQTRFDEDAWTSRTRTPPGYPDAVTLVPDPSVPDLLTRIDTSAGCSIKDSFASVDMTAYGFRVLFDAQWIVHRATAVPPSPDGARWEVVGDGAGLAEWERAWGGNDGPSGVFRTEILDHDSVSVLAARVGGGVVAGAVLNRTSRVVGVSNFFIRDPGGAASWSGCLALAGTLFPGSTFVGYESGPTLGAARAHGFDTVGPLRVWICED
jgi:hypothetical protein